jgi:hypothetical protein
MADGKQQVTDTVDVKIIKAFENFEKPENWDKEYEWERNVSLGYVQSNDPSATERKARIKGTNLWVWDAIGKKECRGKSYTMTLKSGEGSDGKPWTVVVGVVALLLPDGTMKRIQKPAVLGEARAPEIKKLAATAPVTKAAVPATATPPATAKTNGNGKNPPEADMALAFMEKAFIPQSDEWWKLKGMLEVTGAVANATTDMAVRMATCERIATGWPENVTLDSARKLLMESVDHWSMALEHKVRDIRSLLLREKYSQLLSLAACKAHVKALMQRAWMELPKGHYDMLRDCALLRMEGMKNGEGPTGTPVPETPLVEEEIKQEEPNDEDIPF